MDFTKKLRLFAENFGGISKLADALGIAQPSLSRYLSGEVKPGLDFIIKLKDLGCNINWLLSEDDKSPPGTEKLLEQRIKELEEENQRLRDSISHILLLAQEVEQQKKGRRKPKK
ncbi:MAG: helix-turn-helix transcriptional regulator [Ignavibacterium sp.]|jgi:transcriptional regulator with XRE-family HTH domain|uniref:helix-turn-helix transcriptional regulator n=1 Tax=Ignavibacterium sp. TaxID=2651167 RepID=UPI003298AC4A